MALTDGIIGCWSPSVRGSGYLLPDLSGRGNHGTLTNMAGDDWVGASVRGVSGRVLDFDGTDDSITAAIPPVAGLVNCTQAMWFRRTATSALSSFFGVGVAAGLELNRFLLQPWSDGEIYVCFSGSNWGNFTSNDLLWHHLVAVFTGGGANNAARLAVYLDGVQKTLTFNGTIPSAIDNPTSVRLGRTFTTAENYGSGLIAEAAIYNRALTAPEVADLYRRGNGAIGRELTGQTRRRVYGFVPAGFRAYWVRQKSQIIGGGV